MQNIDLSILQTERKKLSTSDIFLMTDLIESLRQKKPYAGLNILYNAHITISSLLQIEALIESGADVTVACKENLRCDPDVVNTLDKAGIKVARTAEEVPNKSYDLALDCCAGVLDFNVTPKYGVVELTKTGEDKFQNSKVTFPVISVDDTHIKVIETELGTGDGFIRGFHKLTSSGLHNKKFVVFGYGKVGKGIVRALSSFSSQISIIESDPDKINHKSQFPVYDISKDRQSIVKCLSEAYCIVTATGVKDVISQYFDRGIIHAKYLANMGSEDEWGDKFATQDILNNKLATNFCLSFPTQLYFLDPIFCIQILALQDLVDNKYSSGMYPLSPQVEMNVLTEWMLHHYRINPTGNYVEQMLHNIPSFVYWKDRDSVYQGCSTNFAQAAGLESSSDIVGRTDYELAWGETEADMYRSGDQAAFDGKYKLNFEETQTQADGKQKVVLASKIPFQDTEGNIVGVLGVYTDITDRKERERLELESKTHQIVINEQHRFRADVRQLMHDITSPTSSINMIINNLASMVPENDRVTLRNATERILGISQRLIDKYENINETDKTEDVLLSLALLQLTNEKKAEYSHNSKIKFIVDTVDSNDGFTFIHHNIGQIKRMLSNLINNAVDAVKDSDDGEIKVTLSSQIDKVLIVIEDNGPGIPIHIQEKFLAGIPVTEGKEKGHGIGLTQVRDVINAGNGTYKIDADEFGTMIRIWFPKITQPNWITDTIKVNTGDTIIILDDDESIHNAWDKIFENVIAKNPSIKIKHFSEGQQTIEYVNSLSAEDKQNIFLLADYELLNQGLNGLDVVNQINIFRVLLVTSYSSHKHIQQRVMQLGIKLLPKEFASNVKITTNKKLDKWSKKVDMLWADDQKWLVDDLIKRHYNQLTVDVYTDPITFMAEIHQYPLDTRIILDTYFVSPAPDNIPYLADGFSLAKDLHELGYKKLILYAGEAPKCSVPEYLTVVLKTDPEASKKLDQL